MAKKKVKVTISVTYSKSLEVILEEGYERKDLFECVEDMRILPNDILQEKYNELTADLQDNSWLTEGKDLSLLQKDIERHTPWHEDELEIIED